MKAIKTLFCLAVFFVIISPITVFAGDLHQLNVEALNNGGTVNNAVMGEYYSGDVVKIIAQAEPGYYLDYWTSSNGGVFANFERATTEFTMPDNAVNIVAVFRKYATAEIKVTVDNENPPHPELQDTIRKIEEREKKPDITPKYRLVTAKNAQGKTFQTFNTDKLLEETKNIILDIKLEEYPEYSIIAFNLERLNELLAIYPSGSFLIQSGRLSYKLPFDIRNNILGLNDFIIEKGLSNKNLELRLKIRLFSDTELIAANQAHFLKFPNGGIVSRVHEVSFELYGVNENNLNFDCNNFIKPVEISFLIINKANATLSFTEEKLGFVTSKIYRDRVLIKTKQNTAFFAASNNVVFTDMENAGHWAEEFIMTSANNAILSGIGEGIFAPEKTVTRAEFVQMLVNTVQLPKIKDLRFLAPIDDVAADSWYYSALSIARHYGFLDALIIDNSILPNKAITREEMAYLLAKIVNYQNIGYTKNTIDLFSRFTDYSEISDKYVNSVVLVVRLKIMNGTSDVVFNPCAITTRAQAATVLTKLISLF